MNANFGNYNPAQYMQMQSMGNTTSRIGNRFANVAAAVPGLVREGQQWQDEMNARDSNENLKQYTYDKVSAFFSENNLGEVPPPERGETAEAYGVRVGNAIASLYTREDGSVDIGMLDHLQSLSLRTGTGKQTQGAYDAAMEKRNNRALTEQIRGSIGAGGGTTPMSQMAPQAAPQEVSRLAPSPGGEIDAPTGLNLGLVTGDGAFDNYSLPWAPETPLAQRPVGQTPMSASAEPLRTARTTPNLTANYDGELELLASSNLPYGERIKRVAEIRRNAETGRIAQEKFDYKERNKRIDDIMGKWNTNKILLNGQPLTSISRGIVEKNLDNIEIGAAIQKPGRTGAGDKKRADDFQKERARLDAHSREADRIRGNIFTQKKRISDLQRQGYKDSDIQDDIDELARLELDLDKNIREMRGAHYSIDAMAKGSSDAAEFVNSNAELRNAELNQIAKDEVSRFNEIREARRITGAPTQRSVDEFLRQSGDLLASKYGLNGDDVNRVRNMVIHMLGVSGSGTSAVPGGDRGATGSQQPVERSAGW